MTNRLMVNVAIAWLIAGAPIIAAAQSTRYRKPPIDAAAQVEGHSKFWEEAVRPGANHYDTLVGAALEILRTVRSSEPNRALDLLREAVVLTTDRAEGWGYLGVANERIRDYRACAHAYGYAHQLDPAWRPDQVSGDLTVPAAIASGRPLALAWAVCLARSGDFAQASHQLETLVARGESSAALFLNLGQIHMAAGRIHDAITAFDRAVDETRPGDPVPRWLLAVAYDRARRTGDAALAAELANESDPGAIRAFSAPLPLIPPADSYYLLALGARLRPDPRPEQAIIYFRSYLESAPETTPWRARAREHLDAIGTLDLAGRATLEGTGDLEAIRSSVRAVMPSLRKCLVEVPTVMLELRITQSGPPGRGSSQPLPRAPVPGSTRTAKRPPVPVPPVLGARPPDAQSPGAHAHVVSAPNYSARAEQIDQVILCVEKAGQNVTLPRQAAGTYATVRVPVIADP